MLRYILIKKKDFVFQNDLKNYSIKQGLGFVQDSIDTIREVKLKNEDERYYVLSYEDKPTKGAPVAIESKYSISGRNERDNKSMTESEIIKYLEENEEEINEEEVKEEIKDTKKK